MIKLQQLLERFRSKRPAHTLFFVTSELTLRVDCDPEGQPVAEPWTLSVPCPSPEQLGECLTASLDEFTQPLGRKVWVLYEGLIAYSLGLATAQTNGLNDELLEQALLYELEGLTGLSTAHKSLANTFLGEEDGINHYWICAAPADLFERLASVLQKRGGKLAGLAHPSGVPASLLGTASNWLRFEYWQDILIALYHGKGGHRQVQVFTGGLQSNKARTAIERWKLRLPQGFTHESLGFGEIRDHEEQGERRFRLDEPETLGAWLSAWLKSLASEEHPYPMIAPGPRPELEYYYMGGIAAAVLLVCLTHFGWHRIQQGRTEAELASLTKLDTDIKAVKEGMKKKQEEKDKLEKEVKASSQLDAKKVPFIFESLRRRPVDLLKNLAEKRSDGMVIEEIAATADDVAVKGVSLQADEPNQLRQGLEDGLQGLAWQATAPAKSDLGYFADGGPWQFEIKLKDLGLAGFNRGGEGNKQVNKP